MKLIATVYSDPNETSITYSSERAKGLSFGTQLPGGFDSCQFSIPVSGWQAVRLYRLLLSKHLVVYDTWGRRVYEGRIEDVAVSKDGVEVEALGYYSNADDLTAWTVYPVGNTKTVRDIIIDAVDLSSLWREDFSRIQANTQTIGPQEFTKETKISDMINKALTFGSDSIAIRRMHFAIWENRIAHYYAEPSPDGGNYDWSVRIDSVTSDYSMSMSRKKVFNRQQAIYDDPYIGTSFTDWQDDLGSQKIFGIREGTINVGSAMEEVADLALSFSLRASAQPEQSTRFTISGTTKSKYGYMDALYMIRAGQLLRIDDFDPSGIDLLTGSSGSDTAVAVITRTDYNAQENTLQVDLGFNNIAMDLLMARLGLSGGAVN